MGYLERTSNKKQERFEQNEAKSRRTNEVSTVAHRDQEGLNLEDDCGRSKARAGKQGRSFNRRNRQVTD